MSNVSAIGEKFVFSKFLEPVSEEAMNKEIENIDAWLEANAPEPTTTEPTPASDSPASQPTDVKESTEEKIARLQAELEAAQAELDAKDVSDEQKKR